MSFTGIFSLAREKNAPFDAIFSFYVCKDTKYFLNLQAKEVLNYIKTDASRLIWATAQSLEQAL